MRQPHGFPILSACLYFPNRLSFRRFTIDLSPRRWPTGAQQSLRSPASRPMEAWEASASAQGKLVRVMYKVQLTTFLFAALFGWLPCFPLALGEGLLRRPSFVSVSVAAGQPAAQPATASNRSQDSAQRAKFGGTPMAGELFPLFFPT